MLGLADTVRLRGGPNLHEIECGCHGVVKAKTQAGHYLLPTHEAAWVRAGLHHPTWNFASSEVER